MERARRERIAYRILFERYRDWERAGHSLLKEGLSHAAAKFWKEVEAEAAAAPPP